MNLIPETVTEIYKGWGLVTDEVLVRPLENLGLLPAGTTDAQNSYYTGMNGRVFEYSTPEEGGASLLLDVVLLMTTGRPPVGGAGVVGGVANSGPQSIVARDAVSFQEFQRLNVIDPAIGRLRPGEAGAAAELQNYLGGTLERAAPGTAGDFVFSSGPSASKSVDFLLTPGSVKQAENINRYFEKNLTGFSDTLYLHLQKADMVPIDTRFLTNENQNLLFELINQKPLTQQQKIILFR